MNNLKNQRFSNTKKSESFFIYGIQPVFEILKSDHQIKQLVIARDIESKIKSKISNLANQNNLEIIYTTKQQMQRFTGHVVHQGVAAEINKLLHLLLLEKLIGC